MKLYFICLISSIFFLIFSILLTQHTAWIEILLYPYLMNNGFILYKDLVVQYNPLMLWFLQIMGSFFGYSPNISLLLTLILALINCTLIYLISKKLWNSKVIAVISVLIFSLWFTYFEGNGLWFELFQTPFILGSFYFSYRYILNTKKVSYLLLGSILLAVSFFIKQSALWLILVLVGWLFYTFKKSWAKLTGGLSILIIPFTALFILTSLVASLGNYLFDYWKWAYSFTFLQFPLSHGHRDYPTISQVTKLTIPLAILLPVIIEIYRKNKKAIFMFLFLIASGMSVFPRWELFHLQPFLAIMSVISAPFAASWAKRVALNKKMLIALVIIIWALVVGRQIVRFWDKPVRFLEPEIYQIAEKILEKEYKNFYAFNAPDQLYILTGTLPPVKPYVQNFAWLLEGNNLQEKIVISLDNQRPQFIIFSPFSGKGGYQIGDYRPKLIGDYIDQNYSLKEKLTENIWVLERKN